jgi:general secretion pathway protein G
MVRFRNRRPRADGFTLIELMIVMAIIVILAGMATALYVNSIQRSKEAVLKSDLFRMRDAIDQYYADKNKYPPSLEALVSEKYLRNVPVDPITNSADTWQTTMADPAPGNAAAESGVFDVKSGAETTAIDGTRYSDW